MYGFMLADRQVYGRSCLPDVRYLMYMPQDMRLIFEHLLTAVQETRSRYVALSNGYYV